MPGSRRATMHRVSLLGLLALRRRSGGEAASRDGHDWENELEREGRCVACGESIRAVDDEVRVHGQRAHTRCTVYRPRRRSRR